MLSFQLFGSPLLCQNGEPLSQFRSQKEVALLVYLAQTGRPQSREFIADLLWDGRSTQQALSNLRTILVRLRKQVGNTLQTSRKTVALAPESQQEVDSVCLLQRLERIGQVDSTQAAAALQCALNSYRGEFLADFTLPDAPRFEQWVRTTREQIHRQVIAAYNKLGQFFYANGAFAEGIVTAQQWLTVDPLDEAAHLLLIRLLLADEQTNTAISHYEHCVALLRDELGIAPPSAMTALIASARLTPSIATCPAVPHPAVPHSSVPHSSVAHSSVAHSPTASWQVIQQIPKRPRHNLPIPHDQFFGRVTDQREIAERLDQPWCRLVTLVGQGGVGKTRLATTVARNRVSHYPDGVWFVELAEIDRKDDDLSEAIAVEMATVLDLRLSGATTPVEQLLDHLQHKAMLLVLDNFEHLLEGGVQLVLELLQRCERVQLLVTSREVLHMRAEWVVTLAGLDYPADEEDATQTDAIDLFTARCRQAHHNLLHADEIALARRICRLVEGLPLAIELAAALIPTRPLQAIADELSIGFDALATDLRDVPQRHRSLQIVFDMSWHTLTPALKKLLTRLAIFRGGFTATAAQSIADAHDEELAALCEKSLLIQDGATARYAFHPILRAYAASKLGKEDNTIQNHAHYYLKLLAQHSAALQRDVPQHAMATLEPDLENLRLAWQSALALRQTKLLSAALTSLSIIYQLRGLAREGEAAMQSSVRMAMSRGAAGHALATRAGLERARFQNRLGRYRAAIETVERTLHHAKVAEDHWAEGMGHVLWGESLWRLGEYEEATSKLNHALSIAYAMVDSYDANLLYGWSHHHLGIIDDLQGRYSAALTHLDQACERWRSLENVHTLSNSLNSIGLVYLHQNDLPAAQQMMEQALNLCNQIDNRYLQTILLNNLSIIATDQGDYVSAHYYLQHGLALATANGNLTSQGEIYSNLGKNYRLLGKMDLAIKSLEEGAQISESIGNRALFATIMLHLAEISGKQGDTNQAESLYRQVLKTARQDHLQHIECEVLISLAEFYSRKQEGEARQYSTQAIALAEILGNSELLTRATAIHQYVSI